MYQKDQIFTVIFLHFSELLKGGKEKKHVTFPLAFFTSLKYTILYNKQLAILRKTVVVNDE